MDDERIKALSDKIWFSKISRIQAEKRLRNIDFVSQALLVWLSFCMVVASFFASGTEYSVDGNFLVVLSILLLVVSTFISGRAFSSRAIGMRHCYERLGYLYTRINQLDEKSSEELDGIAERYYDLLSLSENHASVDFYWALISLRLRKEKCTKSPRAVEIIVAVSDSILRYLFAFTIFFLPLGIFFWNICYGG